MTEQIFGQVASTGLVGALLILAILALRAKDRDLREEQQNRIEDAKGYHTLLATMQREVITAVNKLSDLVESFERRERLREVLDEARAEREHEERIAATDQRRDRTGPQRPPR